MAGQANRPVRQAAKHVEGGVGVSPHSQIVVFLVPSKSLLKGRVGLSPLSQIVVFLVPPKSLLQSGWDIFDPGIKGIVLDQEDSMMIYLQNI